MVVGLCDAGAGKGTTCATMDGGGRLCIQGAAVVDAWNGIEL